MMSTKKLLRGRFQTAATSQRFHTLKCRRRMGIEFDLVFPWIIRTVSGCFYVSRWHCVLVWLFIKKSLDFIDLSWLKSTSSDFSGSELSWVESNLDLSRLPESRLDLSSGGNIIQYNLSNLLDHRLFFCESKRMTRSKVDSWNVPDIDIETFWSDKMAARWRCDRHLSAKIPQKRNIWTRIWNFWPQKRKIRTRKWPNFGLKNAIFRTTL
jgi:hypothetical protein